MAIYKNQMLMEPYHAVLRDALENGVPQFNERTQKTCLMIPGAMAKYDLRHGFPAVTTKKMFFDQPIGELIGFMRGYTSAADFRKVGCKWWDANANENQAWLSNPMRKGEDDLGPIYGKQWTDWECFKVLTDKEIEAGDWSDWGSIGVNAHGAVFRKHINQLEQCLRTILHDPSNRRILFHAWNPADFAFMALPPCHVLYQFIVDTKNNTLHMCMYQRSCDAFLGVPQNIFTSSLLLATMARLTGYVPGVFTHFMADLHIYEDHVEQATLQLTREHYAPPMLDLNLGRIQDDSEIVGAFSRIEPEDVQLLGYTSHPPIKADMAV